MAYDKRRTALVSQLQCVRKRVNDIERELMRVGMHAEDDIVIDHRVAASVRLTTAETLLFDALGDILVETAKLPRV